ncbi:membrane protein [Paramyrothecium foliicola]|nr:membrane protein [Paramyrothecium foliicola]
MQLPNPRRARIVASVAATVISLACGTNYVYSAWAPQFAERLKLSATESNLIGLSGNLGMYLMGVPVGLFVDHRGPRPAVLVGAVLLAVGYFPLHIAYNSASGAVPLLCFFSFLSGFGGCMAFAAAVKTSALNWPRHRGTATAFPLAAFGLSAFFFSLFGSILFPGDPSDFLLLLSCGTFSLTFVGFFFLKTYPASSNYQAVPSSEETVAGSADQESPGRPKPSRFILEGQMDPEPGTSTLPNSEGIPSIVSAVVAAQAARQEHAAACDPLPRPDSGPLAAADFYGQVDLDESTPLIISPSPEAQEIARSSVDMDRSHRVDIRGLELLRTLGFWQLFSIMAILAGVGLMTINNIGNDVKALWKQYDSSVSEDFLVRRQGFHVSILSVGSFLGRLSSGVGSDFLVKHLHANRVWCLVVACCVFLVAQVCALNITDPKHLYFVSTLSGLGYGFLFGVFPSIVAESFGIHGMSQNWGFMTLSPVISSNIFNLFYGTIYDHHSVVEPDGERSCDDGLACYRTAYAITLGACVAGLGVTLWTIHHQHRDKLREAKKAEERN